MSAFAEMFRYNAWANAQLFESCRALTDEQLDVRIVGVSGTVRDLLMHIAGGQETLILRTQGRQNEGELTRGSGWPGIDTLIDLARDTSEQLVSIAAELREDEMVALPYEGTAYRYPKSFFLVHAIEHSIEHRTEIKVALGHIGIETPDLDGWQYSIARGFGEEVPPG